MVPLRAASQLSSALHMYVSISPASFRLSSCRGGSRSTEIPAVQSLKKRPPRLDVTKHTAKPDQLVSSITTGRLDQVDVHPPFRTLLKHKAFLTTWVIENLNEPRNLTSVLCEDIAEYVFALMYFEE